MKKQRVSSGRIWNQALARLGALGTALCPRARMAPRNATRRGAVRGTMRCGASASASAVGEQGAGGLRGRIARRPKLRNGWGRALVVGELSTYMFLAIVRTVEKEKRNSSKGRVRLAALAHRPCSPCSSPRVLPQCAWLEFSSARILAVQLNALRIRIPSSVSIPALPLPSLPAQPTLSSPADGPTPYSSKPAPAPYSSSRRSCIAKASRR